MTDPNTRKSFLYLLGIFALITAMFFAVVRLSEDGVGVLDNGAGKSYASPPGKVIKEGVDYQATFKTNVGEFKVDLLEANAPLTVNNFVFLAEDGFYNNVQFHRIVKDFIIQSGSRLTLDNNPNNDGLGGPGYRFADEINWDSLALEQAQRDSLQAQGFKSISTVQSVPLEKYTLAMANAGPDTNGSQFFFVTGNKDDENIKALNGKHTVFGKVISGQEVIDKINNAELKNVGGTERPVDPVIIQTVEITPAS